MTLPLPSAAGVSNFDFSLSPEYLEVPLKIKKISTQSSQKLLIDAISNANRKNVDTYHGPRDVRVPVTFGTPNIIIEKCTA